MFYLVGSIYIFISDLCSYFIADEMVYDQNNGQAKKRKIRGCLRMSGRIKIKAHLLSGITREGNTIY